MILLLLLLLIGQIPYLKSNKDEDSDLVTAVLMIRDEENVIVDTLKPLVEGGIRSFYIYDTGSIDNTIGVIHSYFREANIQKFLIKEEPFVNYAYSRNKALEYAEEYFKNSTFLFMIDAEWYVEKVDLLLEFCRKHKDVYGDCYNIALFDGRYWFNTARLLRSSSHVRFVGRVHEIPRATPLFKVPFVSIKYSPKTESIERTRKRWLRDKQWLLEDYAENPQDRRLTFLLGQTCQCLGQWQEACNYYKKVTELPPTDEYTYLAFYTVGEILDHINQCEHKGEEAWSEALNFYLKAHQIRSNRAEPLIKIAQHYLHSKDMALSYIFAKRASKIPYPEGDVLFIEKSLYDFDRHRILGICAWHVQDYKTGERAIRKALEVKPEDSALQYDLNCYLWKKSQ